MVIQLLHFDGCTNTAEARRRLQSVLDANELEADVQLVEVRDFEDASFMRFLGSPTIRIDDVDIEPEARLRTDYGFMCRTYRDLDGTITGVPPVALIADALRSRVRPKLSEDAAKASPGARSVAGILAGALATYVQDGVGEAIYARTSEAAKAQEAAVQPKSALSVLAERILRGLGRENPDEKTVERLDTAIDWTFGSANGALYGVLDPVPGFHRSYGAPLILALIAFDEFGLTALGLAQPPARYPAATHVRSIVNHLVYGAVLTVAYRGLLDLRS
jgi:hypothetical protein